MRKNAMKFLSLSLLVLSLVLVLTSCSLFGETKPADETYSIVLPEVENGSISASSLEVKSGESVTLTVTPNENYELEYLKANDNALTVSNGQAIIENITENQNITLNFVGVEVNVTFVIDAEKSESKTYRYNDLYGEMPEANAPTGSEFVGWFTEENGGGTQVSGETVVTNPVNHVLYAHVVATPLEVSVTGKVDKLVKLPGEDAEVMELSVSVTQKGVDITSSANISLVSSDETILVCEGLEVSLAANANGSATISVLVNGQAYDSFEVSAIDYDGLGYQKVATKEEFLAMTGENNYLLTSDIDLENEVLSSRINKLFSGKVIDGNGHVVKNAVIEGGWNKAWILYLHGTVKNIAFVNVQGPNTNVLSTGLVSIIEQGGTLENIYLQYHVNGDGASSNAWENGGTLAGGLGDGIVRNCLVDVVVAEGLSIDHHGAIFGTIVNKSAVLENVYAIVHHKGLQAVVSDASNVYGEIVVDGSVEILNSTYALVNKFADTNPFGAGFVFSEEGLTVYGTKVLTVEEALTAEIAASFELNFLEESTYIDFAVYRYGELSTDFNATYTSSDESVFTTTTDGALIFVGNGTATLTIVVEDSITLTSEITIYTPHVHTYSDVWSGDLENHWHAATCEHNDLVADLAPHTWDEGVKDGLNMVFTCSGCGKQKVVDHEHNASSEWSKDSENHWKVCLVEGCEELLEKATHTWDEGVANDNLKVYTCSTCGQTKSEEIFKYISTAEEWRTLIGVNPSGHFVLKNDIDLAGGWVSTSGSEMLCSEFTGILDGNGYVVKNGWLPGGWFQPGIINTNAGTIKNIGFVNVYGTNTLTNSAIIQVNTGLIENVYVDFIVCDGSTEHGFAGTLVGYSGTGIIRNCIVNVRLYEGLTAAPSNYGSIMGSANAWAGTVENCFAIVNGSGIADIAGTEAEGVMNYLKAMNTAQYDNYGLLKANADLSSFDTNIWSFDAESLSFGGVVRLTYHEHTYKDTYSYDADNHWYEATCEHSDLVSGLAAHTWDEGTPEGLATKFSCVCGATKIVDHEHNASSDWSKDSENHWKVCLVEGCEEQLEKAVHTWDDGVINDNIQTLTCGVCSQTKEVELFKYISTADEWRALITENPAGHFVLKNDIDLAGGFVSHTDASMLCATFSGILDGNGYVVKNGWLPGGWAQPAIIGVNAGTIKNIGFVNVYGTGTLTNSAIIQDNQGLIENVYVDFIVLDGSTEHGFAGTLVGYSSNGTMRNCIINVRLYDGVTVAPSNYGSIMGSANAWAGTVENCFAIVNGSGITDIASTEGAEGIIEWFKGKNCAQFETYADLKATADVSSFDSSIWTFADGSLSFGGVERITTA